MGRPAGTCNISADAGGTATPAEGRKETAVEPPPMVRVLVGSVFSTMRSTTWTNAMAFPAGSVRLESTIESGEPEAATVRALVYTVSTWPVAEPTGELAAAG